MGYGGSVLLQNVGITRTSVSHAALLIGAVPVLVAIIAAVCYRSVARPVAWAGFAVSLAGVGLVAGGHGGGATPGGDGLVLASLVLSAAATVAQVRLLRGRDPVAVTALQFLAATVFAAGFALATEGLPALPGGSAGAGGLGVAGALLVTAALAVGGTLVPFTLFAYGQTRVPAEVAGAFLNLEPLVGAVAGVVAFGDPAGPEQLAGGLAILAGIALSSLPRRRARAARLQLVPCPEIGPGARPGPAARPRAELSSGPGARPPAELSPWPPPTAHPPPLLDRAA